MNEAFAAKKKRLHEYELDSETRGCHHFGGLCFAVALPILFVFQHLLGNS
jgi:hypothetical protein